MDHRLHVALVAFGGCFLAACQSSVDTDSSASAGVTASVQSVTVDSLGTHVALALRNSGAETVVVASYCPGQFEVARAGAWVTLADPNTVCRATATGVDPGVTVNITVLQRTAVASGATVRYVVAWGLLDGPGGGQVTTAPYTVK